MKDFVTGSLLLACGLGLLLWFSFTHTDKKPDPLEIHKDSGFGTVIEHGLLKYPNNAVPYFDASVGRNPAHWANAFGETNCLTDRSVFPQAFVIPPMPVETVTFGISNGSVLLEFPNNMRKESDLQGVELHFHGKIYHPVIHGDKLKLEEKK